MPPSDRKAPPPEVLSTFSRATAVIYCLLIAFFYSYFTYKPVGDLGPEATSKILYSLGGTLGTMFFPAIIGFIESRRNPDNWFRAFIITFAVVMALLIANQLR